MQELKKKNEKIHDQNENLGNKIEDLKLQSDNIQKTSNEEEISMKSSEDK